MSLLATQQAFALACEHLQLGRLAEAEALYRQILTAQPNHAEAMHHLGVIAQQVGRHDLSAKLIRQALVVKPKNATANSDLGDALADQHQFEEAVAAYRRSIQLRPDNSGVHNNLGMALTKLGRFNEAIAAYRRALDLSPDFPEAHYNLGNTFTDQSRFEEAVAAYRRALALRPDFPQAHYNLGNALTDKNQFDEAVAAYRQAIRLKPDYALAHYNLGIVLAKQSRLEESIGAYRRALECEPSSAAIHNNLGNALRQCDRLDEALAAYNRAIELQPSYANAFSNLGNTLKDQGLLDEAMAAYRQAIQINPEHVGVHSNLVYTLHFHPDHDQSEIAEEHRRWNRQFAEPLRKLHHPHANDRDPERRLRIGYVSPDFNRHPISRFLTPLVEAHDKAHVEIYCYASVRSPDKFTERLKKAADVWRDVLDLGDHDLAERIRADEIDILVDLTQHMAHHRLLTFARKPAPVQVGWLGYPAGTGLPAIDYRLTDSWMEPEGSPWFNPVETPIRLPDSWFCFDPIESPQPVALPALATGHITLGSLNNFCKVNKGVLRLWVTVLQTIDRSRLVLHCPAGGTETRLRAWFEAQGLASHRVDLVPRTANRAEYLELFQRIDVGLDPFPYNGGTTTCEALWMGVPVVSLAGRTAVSRLGLSVLINAGLPELVASSEEDYVRIVAGLAEDLPRLAELRATLQSRMRASPLMDAPRFARNMEAAYRMMWKRWSAQNQF